MILSPGHTFNQLRARAVSRGQNPLRKRTRAWEWVFALFCSVAAAGCSGIASQNPPPPSGKLSASPSSVAFGDVGVGTASTQTVTFSNTGTGSLTVSQAVVSGAGFTMTGQTFPLTLAAGQNTIFSAQFAPSATGSAGGSVSITSNAPGSPLTIALSGTGVTATFLLTANPTSLSFGSVNLGSNSSLSGSLTNTGNSNVSISSVTVAGAGFSASGVTAGATLTPNQTVTVNVTFAPASVSSVTGTVTVVSNASNSPTTLALSGTGVQLTTHSAALTWVASTSVVVGYNVYRGTAAGGPYTKLNATPVAPVNYTDSTVVSGQIYFYVVTAVDANSIESVFSNEVTAAIP